MGYGIVTAVVLEFQNIINIPARRAFLVDSKVKERYHVTGRSISRAVASLSAHVEIKKRARPAIGRGQPGPLNSQTSRSLC